MSQYPPHGRSPPPDPFDDYSQNSTQHAQSTRNYPPSDLTHSTQAGYLAPQAPGQRYQLADSYAGSTQSLSNYDLDDEGEKDSYAPHNYQDDDEDIPLTAQAGNYPASTQRYFSSLTSFWFNWLIIGPTDSYSTHRYDPDAYSLPSQVTSNGVRRALTRKETLAEVNSPSCPHRAQ